MAGRAHGTNRAPLWGSAAVGFLRANNCMGRRASSDSDQPAAGSVVGKMVTTSNEAQSCRCKSTVLI